jgi:hypothetical protein
MLFILFYKPDRFSMFARSLQYVSVIIKENSGPLLKKIIFSHTIFFEDIDRATALASPSLSKQKYLLN